MLDAVFSSLFTTTSTVASSITVGQFLICCAASLTLGAIMACVYMFRHDHSKNLVVTLALLPVVVQTVITLVNGNLGVGVAVMGVFSLVRFRSIPGSAKDICSVFVAMAIGLATGMGFIGLAVVMTAVVAVANVIYIVTPFGAPKEPEKMLRVTIPEDLEYDGVFDDVLKHFTSSYDLTNVSTTNMGSLYLLEYAVRMKEPGLEKKMIDELRCLNGNLKISCGRAAVGREAL